MTQTIEKPSMAVAALPSRDELYDVIVQLVIEHGSKAVLEEVAAAMRTEYAVDCDMAQDQGDSEPTDERLHVAAQIANLLPLLN